MTRTALGCIFGVVLALAFVSVVPEVQANDADEATVITFRRPVRIPGDKVLPVGTYLFRSITALSDESYGVVRIYNADGTVIYATFMTKYALRPETSIATQLSFVQPKSKTQPLTLLAWFYPDSLTGHQFVYSNQEANGIAEEHEVTLMTTPYTGVVSSRVTGFPVLQ